MSVEEMANCRSSDGEKDGGRQKIAEPGDGLSRAFAAELHQ